MSEDHLRLGAEFPAATREQWLALVEKVLKGAPFEKLVSRTYDGLAIEPLYSRRPDARAVARGTPAAPWQITQRVDHPDPAAANAEALHDIENGATALSLTFAGAPGSHRYGLVPDRAALDRVLAGVPLDRIAVELDLSPQAEDVPADLAALVTQRGIAPAAANIRFGMDPLGASAASGEAPVAWPETAIRLPALVQTLAAQGFRGPFVCADGRVVHNAGGSEAQELAFVLAAGVAYLRALEAGGITLEAARRMMSIRLAADADQFLTIAKFRALRQLWARVEDACGLSPAPVFISAETAWRMMTQRDPWVNALRTTIAAFAAGIGGADSVTVLPFTLALGLPDRFARRIARNTQLLLIEEANIAKVADASAGSGAVEDLTEKLCTAAWARFQEIEKTGGIWPALQKGLVQEKVAAVRAARNSAVARRKDALTGTSAFPHIHEAPVPVLDVPPAVVAPRAAAAVRFAPLASMRLAEPFEALRDASDRVLAATGSRPKIFLANLGPIAAFTARAMFAKNFFEAGGIEAVINDGFATHADMAAAFTSSGAKLACLCSADEVYAREAVPAAQAIKAAGATHIYLAGRPGELEAALRAAGVHEFIFVGCDVLKTLQAAHAIVGMR